MGHWVVPTTQTKMGLIWQTTDTQKKQKMGLIWQTTDTQKKRKMGQWSEMTDTQKKQENGSDLTNNGHPKETKMGQWSDKPQTHKRNSIGNSYRTFPSGVPEFKNLPSPIVVYFHWPESKCWIPQLLWVRGKWWKMKYGKRSKNQTLPIWLHQEKVSPDGQTHTQ